jgi:hypothetical protein
MSRILKTGEQIRQWAEARSGMPAWSELPSGTRTQIVLRLVFDQYLLNTGESQDQDRPGGLDLVGWDEWLAELNKQKLALRVADKTEGVLDNDFEFVPDSTDA